MRIISDTLCVYSMESYPNVLIITGDKVNLNGYSFGQEYCLRTLVEGLKKLGYIIGILTVREFVEQFKGLGCPEYVHLYYVDMKSIIKIRNLCRSSKLIYHVYHLDDITWSRLRMLRWNAFLIAIQPFVNVYMVTSRSLLETLRRYILLNEVALLEPYYSCNCKSPKHFEEIKEKFSNSHLKNIRLLYLGRLHYLRIPLLEVLKLMKNHSNSFSYKLDLTVVATNLPVIEGAKKFGAFSCTFMNRRLSDDEKCRLYRSSHLFLYLARGNVAMNPPITILESLYHGVLPLSTRPVLQDLDMPHELIVERASDIINFIKEHVPLGELANIWLATFQKLRKYYDEERFLKQIALLHE